MEVQRDQKQTQNKRYIFDRVGPLTAPRGYTFCFNKNLLQTQKGGNGILRNISDQGPFLLSLLCIGQPLKLKMVNLERNGEKE